MASHKPANEDFKALHVSSSPSDIFRSGAELNDSGVNFLKVDLETALTFVSIALEANDEEKRERNRHNARLGYDTVLRLKPKMRLTGADSSLVEKKLELLKRQLMKLGEKF